MIPIVPSRADAVRALALALFTTAIGFWVAGQFRQSRVRPEFYQAWFAPAVMFACGGGFHNVDWSHDKALAAFLLQERDALACGEIGRDLPRAPLDEFQRISFYLEWTVALAWRFAGVSWYAASCVGALLAGLFGAAVYGVMRLGMRPAAASIVSALVVTSPLHVSYVPHLRDYSKAPFLLALVLLMGIAVKRVSSSRQLVWLAVLAGFVAGVGFGFRTDILLAAVPFVGVLFVFRAGSPPMRSRLSDGAIASAVFIASFGLTASPVLGRYAQGGNIGHVILLGFGDSFTDELGLEAKHYALSTPYSDWYQEAAVRSYASRLKGDTHLFAVGSEAYAQASNRYLMTVVLTFPADVTIRMFRAAAKILNAPFSSRYASAAGWVHGPLMAALYEWRGAALERAGVAGWAASLIVIIGVAAWSGTQAAFLVLLVVFLAGGAAIQFHARHFFHLEFMSWWAVGVVADRVVAAGWAIPGIARDREWRARLDLNGAGRRIARSTAIVAAGIVAAAGVLLATRQYQQLRLDRLFEQILAASRQRVSVAVAPAGLNRVMMTLDLPELELNSASALSHSIGTAYLLLDVNPRRCDAWSFSASLRYQAGSNGSEVPTRVVVPLIDSRLGPSIQILLPVYAAWFPGVSLQKVRFEGIDVSSSDADCIVSISKLADLGAFPLLVTAILGSDWHTASHYQTMVGLEAREDGAAWYERVYPTVPALDVGRSVLSRPTADVWSGATVFSPIVAPVKPFGLAIDGTPAAPYMYLFQSRQSAIPRGTCAVAEGELVTGGLTFGILRDGQWYQQVNVLDRGRFMAVGCLGEDGNYSVLLANAAARGATSVRLTKIGWVAPEGMPTRE